VPLISPDSVEQVRGAADLTELVRGRVQLVRQGGRWVGRCPFHDERTPSFGLIPPEEDRYYCFGCGASGDAIDWMQQQEGAAGFAEAIEALADRFGVALRYEEESPEDRKRRAAGERRRELLERAAAFYAEYLWRADEAAPARELLAERGFDEALVRRFGIGYAPAGGAVLARRALEQGFSGPELVDAGLARQRGSAPADFFVARVMFPISDARGRVQGFGARTLDPNERAKYVNSPETAAFQKRHLLFGLHEARAQAAKEGWIVVAEGYTDVMGLVAAGVEAAVACMGTSLTRDQLRLAARSVGEVRLCFDADAAGEGAAWRTVEAAAGVPLRLSAVPLPPGQDPGDLARTDEGRARLAEAVGTAVPLLASLIRSRASRAGGSARERDQGVEDIIQLLRRFPDSVEKDEGVRLAAGLLRLSRAMEDRLRDAARMDAEAGAPPPPPEGDLPQHLRLEVRFLALALAEGAGAGEQLANVAPEAFEDPDHRRAFELMVEGVAPDRWPDELGRLLIRLRVEVADSPPGPGELREAGYRLQVPLLEQRAARLRDEGDSAELFHTLDLLRRVRDALRGEG